MALPMVSVVVPNYNGATLLEGCIGSILAQSHNDLEILVVDAGSTDDSRQLLADRFPQVRVLLDPENKGLTYAQNLGLKAATAEWVVIMNNDVNLEPECFQRMLVAATANDRVASVAPKILLPRIEGRIDSVGILIHRDLAAVNRGHMQQDVGQFDEPCEVFGGSDAVVLLRRQAVLDVGAYDDDFEFYCEEADLAFRLRLAGWICVYEPRAVAHHLYSATIGGFSPRKAFYSERNNFWCLIKNVPLALMPQALVGLVLRAAWLLHATFFARETRAARFRDEQRARGGLLPIVWKITASTTRHLPSLIRKRKAALRLRRVPLREVRSWFGRFGVHPRLLYVHADIRTPTRPPVAME